MQMGTWIKRSFFVCAVFAITWVMFIAYWSGSNHMPDGGDVLLYLLVLPACFLLAVWGIRKAKLSMASAAAAKTAAAAAQPAAATPAEPSHHPERLWTLAVAAGALRSPHGADAAALLEKLQAHEAKLELDPELTDGQGFPVLTGRIADVDAQTTAAEFMAWRGQHASAEQDDAYLPDEQQRTLALAADVARELGDRLMSHPFLDEYLQAQRHQKDAVGLPQLHLLALLPAAWSGEARMQAAQWLAQLVTLQGWPAEKITVLPAIAGEPAHPLLHLDRLIATSRDANTQQPSPYLATPYLAIVIAAQSNLGADTVQDWERSKQLLSGSSPSGKSPGEAAAGFILADATQAIALGAEDPVLLHRATLGRKNKSADEAGRVDGDLLTALAQAALRDAAVPADAVALLVTDGDHRAGRTEEIMKLGYAALPEIDLGSQCLKVGAECGSAGAATVLAALALAHAAAERAGEPALCVSNDDAHERAAIVLTRKNSHPHPITTTAEHSPEATAAQAATA